MLWLCLYFPRLALDILAQTEDLPLAISQGRGRECTIRQGNAAAVAAGVRPGMRLSAAQALCGDLRVRPRDEAMEGAALSRLAAWAGQFTPALSLAPQALLLEIEGSLRLFGGLAALVGRAQAGLQALGYQTQPAVAPTAAAALLFARAGLSVFLTDKRTLAGQLAHVPLRALALPARSQAALEDLGLQRVGEVLRLPREGLARRLGRGFLDDLDRALGRRPETLLPFVPPARYIGRLPFPAEVTDADALAFGAQRLLQELAGFLRARDSGVQRLAITLKHERPPTTRFVLGLVAPSCDPRHWSMLLRERLERVALRAGVVEIAVAARDLRPWAGRSENLFDGAAQAQEGWTQLVDRLRARLGETAVRGLQTLDEHRPERAWTACTPGETGHAGEEAALTARPLWLLPSPVPLAQKDGRPELDGALALQRGPERIESGWWDGGDVMRDYFLACSAHGARLWVFQERRTRRWFLHGIFS